MAKARDEILTEYTGDTRSFARAARFYERTLGQQERLTNDRLNRVDQRWRRSNRVILSTTTALGGLTAGLAVGQVRAYAEAWRTVERRLESVGASSPEALEGLVDLALRTRSVVTGTADAVQRMAKSTGSDFDTAARRVETLQKLLAVGGASGSERASVSLQLGQALKSGVLSGDEYRSISENAPVEFLDALASAAGITRRELKKFAQDQKLTTDIVLQALDGLAKQADESFGALAVSGEEAFSVLRTGLIAYVGSVDQTLGATASLNGMMVWAGEYMANNTEGAEALARAFTIVGSTALALAGSRGMGAVTRSFQQAAVARQADVAAARKQHAQHRQDVIDMQQKLAVAKELRRQRQSDYASRVFNDKATKQSSQQLRAAITAERKAVDLLSGAQARASASAARLTAAQARLSLATRVSALAVRSLNGALAFFGGPIGLALTAIVTTMTVLATRTSEVDRRTQSVTDHVQELSAAYSAAGGKADNLSSKLSQLSIPRALADAEALKRELDEAREKAGNLFDNPRNRRVAGGFKELQYLGDSLVDGRISAQEFREELNRLTKDAPKRFVRAAGAVEKLFTELLEATDASERASDVLTVLTGTATEAEAAMKRLGISSNAAGGDVETLGRKASTAAAGIAELVALIPELDAAAKVQSKIADAAKARNTALQSLGHPDKWGAEQVAKANEINDLFKRAVSEIDGSADATRKADKALADYLNGAKLGALNARDQALERERQKYDSITDALKKANAGQADFERAQQAHEQRIAQIKKSHTKKGGAARLEKDLSAVREVLIEQGHRSLALEIALNAEREKLREMLPDLIALGLTRAEAEAVLQGQLEKVEERLKDVRTASEEAAYSFARGALEDIRHAENLGDAIGGVAGRLQDLATDRAFDLLAEQFANIFSNSSGGGSGGNWLGNILGTFFGSLGGGSSGSTAAAATPRATGGPVAAGQLYEVNEHLPGTEYFVPSQSGAILNVAQAQEAVRQAGQQANVNVKVGGMQVHIHNSVPGAQVREEQTAPGRMDIHIEQQIGGMIGSGKFDKQMRQRYAVKPKASGG
jgi:tape measure domain-containing protein